MTSSARAKVKSPYIIDDSTATLITLKKWFNVLEVYCEQNEEFDVFAADGIHANWTARSKDSTRGINVPPQEAVEAVVADAEQNIEAVEAVAGITVAEAQALTRQRRKDLNALLSIYADNVPENYYEMVLDDATSIKWIFTKLAESLGLQTSKQYFLNSHTIQYDPDKDTPEKLYMRLRGHYQLASPKAGSIFDGVVLDQDVKIGPLAELMLVEKTLERIDPRLPAHIVKTRGQLMEDGLKTLFCVRRLLWNQISTMIDELNNSGDAAQANYIDTKKKWGRSKKSFGGAKRDSDKPKSSFRRNDSSGSRVNFRFDKSVAGGNDKICGSCFRAGKSQEVFLSHHQEQCKNMSRSDKDRLMKAAIRLSNVKEETSDQDEDNKESEPESEKEESS